MPLPRSSTDTPGFCDTGAAQGARHLVKVLQFLTCEASVKVSQGYLNQNVERKGGKQHLAYVKYPAVIAHATETGRKV